MMKIDPKINDILLDAWQAKMLAFKIGPCGYDNGYVSPPKAAFPITLAGDIGFRPISIELDFDGTRYEVAKNISNITALLQSGAELFLPDGFFYRCVYSGASMPDEKAPWISQCTFSLYGVRHDAIHSAVFTESGKTMYVEGNRRAPAVIKITPSDGSEEVTVNGITVSNVTSPVVINGIEKTVMSNSVNKFADTDLIAFPELTPGVNEITFSGASKVEISYYPLYV